MSGTGLEPGDSGESSETQEFRPMPRGCHPLVFGVTMATIQVGALLWLLYC